ncbi:MAG: NAD(+) synthase [Gudongella sp.]|nr:NAD(+) synthase [Gudongella sp.]
MILKKLDLIALQNEIIEWTKIMMKQTGGEKAVLGISGGKDSSVVAALLVKALGKENVIGILMPNGIQNDISYSNELVEYLGIPSIETNIKNITDSVLLAVDSIKNDIVPTVSRQTGLNIPPRIRMTVLYAISQSIDNSRVINTSNLSEDWVGFATLYGDATGAFSPLGMLTSDEVVQLGEVLGLPDKFLSKAPSDGLTGKTDEDVFGFTYEVLNKYIREGIIDDLTIKEKIDKMHLISRFKFLPIPMYNSKLPIVADDIADIYKK